MSEVPDDLKYTSSHEWIRSGDDGVAVIGITDHAQAALGDLVFVEVPEVDTVLAAGDACAIVESVKAASDVYSPLSGIVVAANEVLADAPETVNSDPYGGGWIMRVKLSDPAELDGLLDADKYQQQIKDEA